MEEVTRIEIKHLPVKKGSVPLRVAHGHFATNHSNINYYIDITYHKTRLSEAKASAYELVSHYKNDTPIDTILCLDGTAVLGTCVAEELTKSGFRTINQHQTIYVVEPEYNANSQIIFRDNIKPMTDEKRAEIMAANKAMADKALRVLAVAKRDWDSKPTDNTPEFLEQDLVFLGLTGMIDPVRPEVKAAIEECRAAGIRPVMITGDHKDTAVAIAKELGIITDASEAITGAELDNISDDDICDFVQKYGVYARVQPEHKTRIVNAWKKIGAITAMTGDGVNDAPSIKSADIGVGMGITGTDVTKNVADMVLADDNFATIVTAVGEGRRIYDNIRKAIQFLLASNMSEVLGVFSASLMGFTLLNPVHLLFINLVTDCFPALALGMEKAEPDTMNRPPRNSKDGIFSGGLGFDVVYQGILVTIITIVAYLIGASMDPVFANSGNWFDALRAAHESGHGMTMAFLTMSMCEIFHSFNLRSQRKSVFSLKSQNKILWAAMLGSLLLTTLVIEVPFLANAFGFTTIGWDEYAISIGLAFLVIPVVEFVKLIQRIIAKRR